VESKRNDVVHRIALAIPEQRRDLGLSARALAQLSGVSRHTIGKLEAGGMIGAPLLLRLASTLTLLELYAAPRDEAMLIDMERELGFRVARVGGAA
jgi:transcriptional regulator with XRE-family HTH domain